MKPYNKPTWILMASLLVLVTLACSFSFPFNLRRFADRSADDPNIGLAQDFDLLTEAQVNDLLEQQQTFLLPDMPGSTIPLEIGSSLFVPEGALPEGTTIQAQVSEAVPLLPEDIAPVGDALIITADTQPQTPLLLRMPIPAGVSDPTTLAIYRVEADGKSTFLMTEVEGTELVAFTPGFSKVGIANIFNNQPLALRGPGTLRPGQPATYSIFFQPESTFGASWKISGDSSILFQSDTSAIIQAGDLFGRTSLSVEFIDIRKGMRWFGSRYITIMTEPGFSVSLVTQTPVINEGEQVRIRADVFGTFTAPISWTWHYDDGGVGGSATTEANVTAIDLPPRLFAARDHAAYLVVAKAQDANGKEAVDLIAIRVDRLTRVLTISGEQEKTWVSPGVFGGFEATARGQDRAYRFNWRLNPGEEVVENSAFATTDRPAASIAGFMFLEPGEYLVEVVLFDVTDGEVEIGKAALPVRVQGGEPLNAHILSWPDPITPNEPADFRIRIRGGTRVLGGKKGPYTATIYWGDGSSDRVNPAAISEDGGASFFTITHRWQEAGPYTVMVFVEDPAGSITYTEADVTVKEKIQTYQGVIEFMSYPETSPFGLGIDSDMTSILDSQVHLTITDSTVSAYISLTYRFCRKYSLTRIPNQQPEHVIECFCEGIADFVFTGEGPLTDPFSLVLTREYFTYTLGGSDCARVDTSEGVSSTTLTGTFYEDGRFYGILDPDQLIFRFLGVFADLVTE